MNINIICIGKIKDKYINEGIAEFSKRMTSFANLNIIELKEYNKEDNMNISIDKESQDILKQLSKTNSYNILLDLNGKELSSEDSVDMKLKFSHFTFPHQLMRLILLEQVYRWFAISNNIKYHK